MFCGYCGRQGEGRFCGACGRPMEELPLQTWKTSRGPARASESSVVATAPAVEREPIPGGVAAVPRPTYGPAQRMERDGGNVTVTVPGPRIVFEDETGTSLILRVVWFVFFGWWIGQICLTLAWVLNLTIIGLPLGLFMLNKLPVVMTLKPRSAQITMRTNADGSYTVVRRHRDQHPFWVRAVYFALVGWWASLLWAEIAFVLCLLIITLPVGFMMFDRIPAVTTLARY